ncbi:hypothetical protein ACWGBJ_19110 [Streptomyces sp. NPDC054951]
MPGGSWEVLASVAAAFLGLGEVAQQHQDTKIVEVLYDSSSTD